MYRSVAEILNSCPRPVSTKFSRVLMVWGVEGWGRVAEGSQGSGCSQDFRVRSLQTHKYVGFDLQIFNKAQNLNQVWVKIMNFHLAGHYYF